MDEPDRLVPRTHSDPQGEPARPIDLMDLENDVRASREMADALFHLLERAAVHGATEHDFNALVRCAAVLQDFTVGALLTWEAAMKARRAA